MIDHQFYPTPPDLAQKAWKMFNEHAVTALLEGSAGRGDLITNSGASRYKGRCDCIESMGDNIAVLKQQSFRVIDTDFLTFSTSKVYSHILINPPFQSGVDHVLKAWDVLIDGEMVAIINAATIENPNSTKKKFLISLIEEFGEVEFVESAFLTPETQRKTAVKVAIVHLTKKDQNSPLFNIKTFALDNDTKHIDDSEEEDTSNPFAQQIALSNSNIKNAVLAFNAAAGSLEDLAVARSKAQYYKDLVRAPKHIGQCTLKIDTRSFNEEYDELKTSAWAHIINATEFTSRFSKKVVKNLEADLDTIKVMQFTVKNIYGLLEGLMLNKNKLDNDMILDTFDSITAYHSTNRNLYRGWKSNDKHKTHAFRLKHTRFILPTKSMSDASYFCYESKRELGDFDKVFALIDGKIKPETSLLSLFENKENYKRLVSGERLASSYLECRYYPSAGTIHYFPTKKGKVLIDRFNRVVGKLRNWMPDSSTVSPAFWEQYEKAEKITKEIEKDRDYQRISNYELNFGEGRFEFEQVHSQACKDLNIPVFNRLEADAEQLHPQQQLALSA